MRRGLVIGKFMPVHNGHLALIRFAAEQCDELIVSMSYKNNDPIKGVLRYGWLKQLCQEYKKVKVEIVEDDFDDESFPLMERTRLWAIFIKKRFPPVDAIFSSEEYGSPFATHLGISHIEFDRDRTRVPVSATLIRSNPHQYWEFIPEIVRPFFVLKVCFFGPESTGKSVMAKKLAKEYKTEFVPEVARELITSNEFSVDDIIRIGQAQTDRVLEKLQQANKILFCDTDVITTQIYSQKYLNVIPPILKQLEEQIKYDLYFLFDIDVPWVADELRDLGGERKSMLAVFRTALEGRYQSYIWVRGDWTERERTIKEALSRFSSRFNNFVN